jgi:hypothetical protein
MRPSRVSFATAFRPQVASSICRYDLRSLQISPNTNSISFITHGKVVMSVIRTAAVLTSMTRWADWACVVRRSIKLININYGPFSFSSLIIRCWSIN